MSVVFSCLCWFPGFFGVLISVPSGFMFYALCVIHVVYYSCTVGSMGDIVPVGLSLSSPRFQPWENCAWWWLQFKEPPPSFFLSHCRGQQSNPRIRSFCLSFRAFRSLSCACFVPSCSPPLPLLSPLSVCILPYLTADQIGSWHSLTYLLVYMKASYSPWNSIKFDLLFVSQKPSVSVCLSPVSLSPSLSSPLIAVQPWSEATSVQGLEVGKRLSSQRKATSRSYWLA